MGTTPTPIQQVKNDLTHDEAQFIAALRAATTAAQQDGAQLITDAKAAGNSLWSALQQVLNGGNTPSPAAAKKK
jgi:hypothetical protein